MVFVAGGPVLWKSKKQTYVASSTTEAEFTNLLPAGQAVLWIWNALKELGAEQSTPTVLYTDSANGAAMALNPLQSARTRCIDIRYKWVIDRVSKGVLKVDHVSGKQMPADGLTKPLSPELHR